MSLKAKLEAVLFMTDKPLRAQAIAGIVGEDVQIVRQALLDLIHEYEERAGGLEIADEDGYSFQVKDTYANLMDEFLPIEMTAAMLRTLSAIALKQPISQSEIIRVRGAGAYDHIRELVTRELILKREDEKSRSPMLSTTKKFQEYFRLTKDGNSLRQYLKKEKKKKDKEEEQLSLFNGADDVAQPVAAELTAPPVAAEVTGAPIAALPGSAGGSPASAEHSASEIAFLSGSAGGSPASAEDSGIAPAADTTATTITVGEASSDIASSETAPLFVSGDDLLTFAPVLDSEPSAMRAAELAKNIIEEQLSTLTADQIESGIADYVNSDGANAEGSKTGSVKSDRIKAKFVKADSGKSDSMAESGIVLPSSDSSKADSAADSWPVLEPDVQNSASKNDHEQANKELSISIDSADTLS